MDVAPRMIGIRYRLAVSMILAMAAVDWTWNLQAGLSFSGWTRPCGAAALMFALSAFYARIRQRPAIADMTLFTALWVCFAVLGAVQTYLGATLARPLMDAAFAQADQWIGFDWPAWLAATRRHPVLDLLLQLVYFSLMPQIILTVIVVAVARVEGRNQELLLNAGTALALTTALAAAFPALGPFVHFGVGAVYPEDAAYLPPLVALRSLQPPPFALDEMQGIVFLPSFHTVLACLFTYAHRRIRWTFWPVLALNLLVLVSVPTGGGGHYLVDILAGFAVTAAAISFARLVMNWSAAAGPAASRPPRAG